MGSLFSPFLECPPYTYSCGENKSAMVWLQLKIETVTMNCMHSYHILLPTNALDLKRFFFVSTKVRKYWFFYHCTFSFEATENFPYLFHCLLATIILCIQLFVTAEYKKMNSVYACATS
jgi:hypothetical protein